MNNEEKILSLLETLTTTVTAMQSDIAELKNGQQKLEQGQKNLELRYKSLEQGQKQLEIGQKQLEYGQIELKEEMIAIKIQQRENTDYVKSLVTASAVHKAEVDAIHITLARIEGKLNTTSEKVDQVEDKLIFVEQATYNNWGEIMRLKRA